jgi:hypothetical protein
VLSNPKTGKSIEVRCLIDSGAGESIFNAALAEGLGLNVRSGAHHPFFGISGDPVMGYDHPVRFRLRNDTNEYPMTVSFLPGLNVTGLLGRGGFFEHYRVIFEQYHKRFELFPQPIE